MHLESAADYDGSDTSAALKAAVIGQGAQPSSKQARAAQTPGRKSKAGAAIAGGGQILAAAHRQPLEIALVNNMPDAALLATERQFKGLLQAAAGDLDIRLHLFCFAEVPRSETAIAAMNGRYAPVAALEGRRFDGLIVTGNEPKTADLRDEPYWPEMTWLIDWAEDNTRTSLWSCLAAHAAVLHLDQIERQPLARKCSGVFTCEQVADDPLTAGIPALIRMPHSRKNTLPIADLVARGYHLLTQSREVGADLFVRQGRSRFVFFQGHPEYDADGLLKEYCRDVGRHLRGESDEPPALPSGYFDSETEGAFLALAQEARRRPSVALIDRCHDIADTFSPPQPWRPHAEAFYANWLIQMASVQSQGATHSFGG